MSLIKPAELIRATVWVQPDLSAIARKSNVYRIFTTLLEKSKQQNPIEAMKKFSDHLFRSLTGTALLIAGSATFVAASLVSTQIANAQGIEQLLIERVAIPTPRPDIKTTASVQTKTMIAPPIAGLTRNTVAPAKGTLTSGLSLLEKGEPDKAIAIRLGMPAGSLDRKILAWAIAISGKSGVASGTIAEIAQDLPDWPGQMAMRRNAERALSRENPAPNVMVDLFKGREPLTVEGALALAKAYQAMGNRGRANSAIAPFWRGETLDKKTEKKILDGVGGVLNRADHRHRMHRLFYNDRVRAA
ncbi:MAG: hypothetical protein AAF412_05575, partial [Pseudomonadota bacterium]